MYLLSLVFFFFKQKTAYEMRISDWSSDVCSSDLLMQRNEERLLQLGPVLERLHGEFLDQLINRTFNQCVRAGILPEAPAELAGQSLKVNYIRSEEHTSELQSLMRI